MNLSAIIRGGIAHEEKAFSHPNYRLDLLYAAGTVKQ